MATVRFAKTGYAEMYPTKMGMSFVFKGKSSENASDSLAELSEVVSSFNKIAEEECCSIFSKNLKITRGGIRTVAVYNTADVNKGSRVLKEKEFSHYESIQTVYITTDLNIDILVSLLGRVIDNENLFTYNYSFGVSDEEWVSLKNKSVRDAYNKGIDFCNYLKTLQDWAYGYRIDDMSLEDLSFYERDMACASKSSNFENSLTSKKTVLIKECINVEKVKASSKIKFEVDFR
jgi:hypothetical protein